PERIVNVVKCKNPRCITSTEQQLDQIFRLTDADTKTYRCIYCDSKL
ncbi:MAG: aspartate carbamoyltransferase regulatory subunit, partial [Clostridiales bacterium]|nr:aspartate carbamoyltransferase regulatory subunit [Clostridiales bacterium]